jgi:hypothetical protein
MKRNVIIIMILVVFAFISLLFVGPPLMNMYSEGSIRSEISKANYCNSSDDCVNAGSVCPFGCYILVNKGESQRIKNLLENYHPYCMDDCLRVQGFTCDNGKCEVIR